LTNLREINLCNYPIEKFEAFDSLKNLEFIGVEDWKRKDLGFSSPIKRCEYSAPKKKDE